MIAALGPRPYGGRMLPQTIDDVIERLEAIIVECTERNDRIGYFAALYNRVTITVRDGIGRGDFEDNARMEHLDVVFANRFIDAYDRYHDGELPTRSWMLKFDEARNDNHCVLQHLLLGMNAHIHLDLGIAAARTAPGSAIDGLQGDFETINAVLASLLPEVESELASLSPAFATALDHGKAVGEKIVNAAMTLARSDAWHFATALAHAPRTEWASHVDRRDRSTHELAGGLLHLGPVGVLLHRHESKDVRRNIAAIAEGEFDLGKFVELPD